MKFGVREVANVVFKAREKQTIGSLTFLPGQPVLYIDTAKISTIQQNSATFYAVGGLYGVRMLGWEGQKALTFTIQDAIISPRSMALLSKAGMKQNEAVTAAFIHHISNNTIISDYGVIDLSNQLGDSEVIDPLSPLFIISLDRQFDISATTLSNFIISTQEDPLRGTKPGKTLQFIGPDYLIPYGTMVVVDYYIKKSSKQQTEIIQFEMTMQNLSQYYYYIEADVLFKRLDGVDLPAILTFPNVKIQPNFNLSFTSVGEPNSFTFTMDAFPAFTFFNREKKFLCLIEVVEYFSDSVIIVRDAYDVDEQGWLIADFGSRPPYYSKTEDEKILVLIEEYQPQNINLSKERSVFN